MDGKGGGCHETVRESGAREEQDTEDGARLGTLGKGNLEREEEQHVTDSAVDTSTSGEFLGPLPTLLKA